MSFYHIWKIKFVMVEYPPLCLLILGLHSFWNSCTTICFSYQGGYLMGFTWFTLTFSYLGGKVMSSLTSAWGFRGVEGKPPFLPVAKCTWQGWCKPNVSSSANLSSKKALPTTEIFWDSLDKCSMPAPHLTFTSWDIFHMSPYVTPLAAMEEGEVEASEKHYSAVPRPSPGWFVVYSAE